MYVIQRTLYDDVGIKFLKTLLLGIVKDIIAHEKPISVGNEHALKLRCLFSIACIWRRRKTRKERKDIIENIGEFSCELFKEH